LPMLFRSIARTLRRRCWRRRRAFCLVPVFLAES
jgi:hypothetical protein